MAAFRLAALILLVCLASLTCCIKVDRNDVLAPSRMYHLLLLRSTASRLFFTNNITTNQIISSSSALKMFRMIEPAIRESFIKTRRTLLDYPDQCRRDMAEIYNSTGRFMWASKYTDATASRPSGLLMGNLRWFGDFDECLSIEPVVANKKANTTITPKYCRLAIQMIQNLTEFETILNIFSGLTMGMCVSSSCEIDSLSTVIDPALGNLSLSLSPVMSRCLENDVPYTGAAVFAIFFYCIVALLLFAGFATDVHQRLMAWFEERLATIATKIEQEDHQVFYHSAKKYASIEKMTQPPPSDEHQVEKRNNNDHEHSRLIKVALCFSPYTNFIKLFTLPPSTLKEVPESPNLTAFNGIRALSLFWVILGHCYVFMLMIYDNFAEATGYLLQTNFMFIVAGVFAVDTFLFLSGFLAYWSMSKQLLTGSFWKRLPVIYLLRYIRLTVPYLAAILICTGLWAHLSTGPFYFQGNDYNCYNYWWANLLYIHNFAGVGNQCIPWSWYLSVDMQLFLIAPVIIYLLNKKPRYGWYGCLGLLLVQVVTTMSLTFAYKLPAILTAPMSNTTEDMDRINDYYEVLYVKPYIRLAPYVIGIVCAHITLNHAFELRRRIFAKIHLTVAGWLLMFGLMLTVTYSQIYAYAGHYDDPVVADAFYGSFSRIAWSVAIGWLVLTCVFNQAGPIQDFLSWPYWAIPARLSYCGYLMHPFVLLFYIQTTRRPFHSTDLTNIWLFCGTIFATLIVATVHSLAFESPVISLLNLLTKRKSQE